MRTEYIEGIGLVQFPETEKKSEAAKKGELSKKPQKAISHMDYQEGPDGILYPKIATDQQESMKQMPMGLFTAAAIKYLTENHPDRVQEMKIRGTWFSTIYQIDNQAMDMMDEVQAQLRQQHPAPNTENFMELVKYNVWIRDTAQEIVLSQVVQIPR